MRESEIEIAECYALDSALRFMTGQPWNVKDEILTYEDMDIDLMELAVAVLFAPAVVYVSTGKAV